MSVEVSNASPTHVIPVHSYTVKSMGYKRFSENTTTLALTLGLVIPTLNNVNRKLDECLKTETNVTNEEIVEMFKDGAMKASMTYADRMARVICQTGLACTFIASENPYLNSYVYLWDLYPRLHQRYVDRLCQILHIPRFLATLLGPSPTKIDVEFLETKTSPLSALEDSLKRNTIYLFGDIVVDIARIALDKNVRKPMDAIVTQVACRATATLSGACGACLGRLCGGENGQYWGELIGFSYGFTLFNLGRAYIQQQRSTPKPKKSSSSAKKIDTMKAK